MSSENKERQIDERETKGITAIIIIEVLGRPPEHIIEVLDEIIEKLGAEKGVKINDKKIREPTLLKDKKDLYTSFVEIEVEVEGLSFNRGSNFKEFSAKPSLPRASTGIPATAIAKAETTTLALPEKSPRTATSLPSDFNTFNGTTCNSEFLSTSQIVFLARKAFRGRVTTLFNKRPEISACTNCPMFNGGRPAAPASALYRSKGLLTSATA